MRTILFLLLYTALAWGQTGVPIMTTSPDLNALPERGIEVSFSYVDSATDYHPTQFFWSFGDSLQGKGSPAVHHYKHPGTFKAILITSDDQGNQRNFHVWVKINPPIEILEHDPASQP